MRIPPAAGRTSPGAAPRTGARPPGFRWIAVRPGPPPPPRRPPRVLGPTPRYRTVPRWGLVDPVAVSPSVVDRPATTSAPPAAVRATLLISAGVFALAAAAYILRYVLLLINRTVLLPPWLATAVLLGGIMVSLAAIVAVIVTAAVMTSWLIARRAAVYAHHGQDDPRPTWMLWAGCVIPVVNLVWAPIFVIELARAEQSQARLRGPITAWWIVWVLSTAISAWAIWTSSATEPQGIADNTVVVIIGYLVGLATLLLLWRVFNGFVRKAVDRPLHRWVIVAPGQTPPDQADPEPNPTEELPASDATTEEPAADATTEALSMVESQDREPAA